MEAFVLFCLRPTHSVINSIFDSELSTLLKMLIGPCRMGNLFFNWLAKRILAKQNPQIHIYALQD
jgi:hypothetical protein